MDLRQGSEQQSKSEDCQPKGHRCQDAGRAVGQLATHSGFTRKFFPLPPSRTVSFFLSLERAFLMSVEDWKG